MPAGGMLLVVVASTPPVAPTPTTLLRAVPRTRAGAAAAMFVGVGGGTAVVIAATPVLTGRRQGMPVGKVPFDVAASAPPVSSIPTALLRAAVPRTRAGAAAAMLVRVGGGTAVIIVVTPGLEGSVHGATRPTAASVISVGGVLFPDLLAQGSVYLGLDLGHGNNVMMLFRCI